MAMKLKELVEKIERGEITIESGAHRTNGILERIQMRAEQIEKMRVKDLGDSKVDDKSWQKYLDVMERVEDGLYLPEVNVYCFNCDNDYYIVLIGNELHLIDSSRYWEIHDQKGKDYRLVREDIQECPANELVKSGVSIVEIDVPTGELVFQNYFERDEYYDFHPDEEYEGPGINSIMGRKRLMDALAKHNVGYAQMGNMSVDVYSNGKEILIGDDLDCFYDNQAWFKEHPDEMTERDKREQEEYQEYEKMLQDKGFEHKGGICLDVWRWQCADRSIIDDEEMERGCDRVIINVEPGRYRIEHYYDHKRGPIYSQIKRVQNGN